jgi:plastocyanin
MTWLWVIFFSALPLAAGSLTGRVELRDSRDPVVRKGKDFSGVVISLKPVSGPAPARAADSRAVMAQSDKTFAPHVLAVAVGASVEFPNNDPIFHNAFSSYNGQIFDIGLYPPGSTRSVRFRREGVVRVFCNIHSSMSAVIVVLGTPYFAVTKKDGSFAIPSVPPGEYQMDVFHERATEATLQALSRRVTVEPAGAALPPVEISEAGYLPMQHKNKYGREYPPLPDDHSVYPAVRK